MATALQEDRWRQWQRQERRRVRFGGSRDLRTYMAELDEEIRAFDAWVSDTPAGALTDSFLERWDAFMNAQPATTEEGRPIGWWKFFATTHPGILAGQNNPDLRLATAEYERELAAFYDEAYEAELRPPAGRPPSPSSYEGLAASAGIGVLFLLGGAALLIASRTPA